MSCAIGLVKIIVFIFNFLCALVGLALTVVGSIFYVSVSQYDKINNENLHVVPGVVIGLGVIVFVISFLGCCGTCQKSQCMLILYAVILLLLFVVQLAVGIYGYVKMNGDTSNLKTEVFKGMEKALNDSIDKNTLNETFGVFEHELKCCGVIGPDDYTNRNNKIPLTCYNETTHTVYQDGCGDKIFDALIQAVRIVAYVAIGIAVIELVGALFAICLVASIRNDERRNYA